MSKTDIEEKIVEVLSSLQSAYQDERSHPSASQIISGIDTAFFLDHKADVTEVLSKLIRSENRVERLIIKDFAQQLGKEDHMMKNWFDNHSQQLSKGKDGTSLLDRV